MFFFDMPRTMTSGLFFKIGKDQSGKDFVLQVLNRYQVVPTGVTLRNP